MKKLLYILVGLISVSQAQTIQYIGAPTTTVISKGNFRSDSLFYLPKRTKLPTDSGAVRYQISDSSVYYWTGSQWRRLGVHIDTASMLNPYLRGSGTANYLPKFNASRSIVDSKVYESATNLMFNTTTPYFTTSGIGSFDINGSTASVLVLRKGDTARGYWSHNGSTMDINNIAAGDIRFYTNAQLRGRFQTDGTFRLNSLTGTGSRIVTADADGVLSATSSATGLVDTLVLSTRDWRQKGDDSLGAIIATKGSGTVTSVATGYGLSGGTITTTGTIIVDSAIVASRLRVGKVVDSLALVKQNVLTNPVTGTGTTNYVPKFTGTSTIGNSLLYDNGTRVAIGTTSPATKFQVLEASNQQLGLYYDATNYAAFGSRSNGDVQVYGYTTGTGYRNILLGVDGSTSGGNVGIGTTVSPWNSSHRAIQFQYNGTLSSYSSIAGIAMTSNGYASAATTWKYLETYPAAQYQIGNGQHRWYIAPSGTVGDTIIFTQSMFLNSSGYLGIGTTNPIQKFVVSNGGAEGVEIQPGLSSNQNLILSYNRSIGAYNELLTRASVYNFQIGTSNALYINANNETLLNTTTDAGDYKLQVSGNTYVTGTTVLAASSGSVGISVVPKVWNGSFNFLQYGETGAMFSRTAGVYQNGMLQNAYFDNTDTRFEYLANSSAQYYVQDGTASAHRWFTAASGTANNALTFTERLRLAENGELYVGLNGAPTDVGNYALQVNGAVLTNQTYSSSAPANSTSGAWKLGIYNATAPTATGYVTIEIDGVVYKLLAATN
jgi:hypothetical protein